MRKILSICVINLLLLSFFSGNAQSIRFTQLPVGRLLENPAMTGSTDEARAGLLNRSQWSSIPGAFSTVLFYGDYNISDKHGLGLTFLKDQSGGGFLSTTQLGLSYSYGVELNTDWRLNAGSRLALTRKSIDVNQQESVVAAEQISSTSQSDLDLAAGLLLSHDKMWLSLGAEHLLQPKYSFLNDAQTGEVLKVNARLGSKLLLKQGYTADNNTIYLYPSLGYQKVGAYQSIELNVYSQLSAVIAGIQVRSVSGLESASGVFGFQIEGLRFLYSYDHSLNELSSYNGGSHEVSLFYQFNVLKEWSSEKKRYPWF